MDPPLDCRAHVHKEEVNPYHQLFLQDSSLTSNMVYYKAPWAMSEVILRPTDYDIVSWFEWKWNDRYLNKGTIVHIKNLLPAQGKAKFCISPITCSVFRGSVQS